MKFAYTYGNHHDSGSKWEQGTLKTWLASVFDAPRIRIGSRCTTDIRTHVKSKFLSERRARDYCLNSDVRLTVLSLKRGAAFQIHTGNIRRAAYDLLKLECLYKLSLINTVALALLRQDAVTTMGGNMAYARAGI